MLGLLQLANEKSQNDEVGNYTGLDLPDPASNKAPSPLDFEPFTYLENEETADYVIRSKKDLHGTYLQSCAEGRQQIGCDMVTLAP